VDYSNIKILDAINIVVLWRTNFTTIPRKYAKMALTYSLKFKFR
jgi:hypothetical protein